MKTLYPRLMLLGLVHCVCPTGLAIAEDAAPDAVVLPYGAAPQIEELAALGEAVSQQLRDAGLSLLSQPSEAFATLHSREARSLDTNQLAPLVENMERAVGDKNLERIGELANAVMAKAASVPEAFIEGKGSLRGSLRYALLQACFEGVSAYVRLNKVSDGRQLIEYCSSLPWLVARDTDVRPDVRAVLLRDLKSYDLALSSTPPVSAAWLQGAPVALGANGLRTLPGARLAAMVDCGSGRRVHWLVAGPETSKLALHVDCAFDAAVHSDDRGLWLSTTASSLVAHGLDVARTLGASRVVLVGKEADRYVLRSHTVSGGRSATVTLPLVYGDRQLAAAVDELMQTKQAPAAAGTPAPISRDHPSWMWWAGGSALAVGVGGEIAAWFLYRSRSDKGEVLLGRVDVVHSAPAWEDARAPMLGLGAAGAGVSAAGVALLVAGAAKPKVPWWLVGVASGAGIALATWATVDLVKGDACNRDDIRECIIAEQQRDRGALLLMSAVPLLTVPMATLARRERARLDVNLLATPHGAYVRGSW